MHTTRQGLLLQVSPLLKALFLRLLLRPTQAIFRSPEQIRYWVHCCDQEIYNAIPSTVCIKTFRILGRVSGAHFRQRCLFRPKQLNECQRCHGLCQVIVHSCARCQNFDCRNVRAPLAAVRVRSSQVVGCPIPNEDSPTKNARCKQRAFSELQSKIRLAA